MVFKLVRTDTVEPCKIQLPVGAHLFGRGKFFNCQDQLVSRNHGIIEVTDDTVRIKALHKNPCFYVRKGRKETLVLRKNDAVDLANGDRFGLLPDSYWYELLYCTLSDVDKPSDHLCSQQGTVLDKSSNMSGDDEKSLDMDDAPHNEDVSDSPSLLENQQETQHVTLVTEDQQENSTEVYKVTDLPISAVSDATALNVTTEEQQNNSTEDCKISALPTSAASNATAHNITTVEQQNNSTEDYEVSALPTSATSNATAHNVTTVEQQDNSTEDCKVSDLSTSAASNATAQNVTTEDQQHNSTEDYEVDDLPTSASSDTSQQSVPIKRSHSSDNSDDLIKKVKIEPENIKQESDMKPGPSNNQDDASNSNDKNRPSALPRERCMYGANCYRKNPQHKAEFCHPSDADWGPGERGVCPWGAGCRRRDPRHWRDHTHPPGTQRPALHPPAPQYIPGGKKRKKRSKSPEISTDLIVAGKRTRRTVNRPSWSGSESEDDLNDPFLTDESDEWEPPSDLTSTQSDYTQDTQDY